MATHVDTVGNNGRTNKGMGRAYKDGGACGTSRNTRRRGKIYRLTYMDAYSRGAEVKVKGGGMEH